MKKVYETPNFMVENFMVNAYCDTDCGKSGDKYLFQCTYGEKGENHRLYTERNGVPGLQTEAKNGISADRNFAGFIPCGVVHETDSYEDFMEGYYVENNGRGTPVIIWVDENKHAHAMLSVPVDHWEIERS